MKICNNCSATNNLTAVKCVTCNMHGNFRPLTEQVEMPSPSATDITCMNCGNIHTGEAAHCHHCRFPVSRGQVRSFSNRSLQMIRKVG